MLKHAESYCAQSQKNFTAFLSEEIAQWDALREEVGELIGDEGPDRWLTILFTADPEWAD